MDREAGGSPVEAGWKSERSIWARWMGLFTVAIGHVRLGVLRQAVLGIAVSLASSMAFAAVCTQYATRTARADQPAATGWVSSPQQACAAALKSIRDHNNHLPGSFFQSTLDQNDTRCEIWYTFNNTHTTSIWAFITSRTGNHCTPPPPLNISLPTQPQTQPQSQPQPQSCQDPSKAAGRPIIPATGEKYLDEIDYQGTGPHALSLVRKYRSHRVVEPFRDAATSGLSPAWSHNHSISLSYFNPTAIGYETAKVKFGDGEEAQFRWDYEANGWAPIFGSIDSLIPNSGGMLYKRKSDNSSWQFDANGKLLTRTELNGWVTTHTYSTTTTPSNIAPGAGYLLTVSNHFGRSLGFVYASNGEIQSITTPDGQTLEYSFDGTAPNRRLIGASFNGSLSGRVSKTYHYESAVSNQLLTGVTDENGMRYATYAYDAQGRGISTQLALGADLHSIAYGTGTATVTDPLGKARTYNFGTAKNQLVVTGSTEPSANGANNAATRVQDGNGFQTQETDFLGVTTMYTWDNARRLPLSTKQAAGRPEERIISTQWHATLPLPILQTEPGRTTAYTYDAVGNKLSQIVTDTATNATRTLAWTYNTKQLVATEIAANGGVTQYSYDANGQVTGVTDPLGRVTTYEYNTQGQLTLQTAPNGLTTAFTYDQRGQVKTQTSNGLITAYTYRPDKRIATATLPSGQVSTYAYDNAQRLTGWTDNRGSSAVYTLDAMGNRIGEQLKDGSAVVWQLARTINNLNRVTTETTGANQSQSFGYNANGDRTSQTNGLSQSTIYGLDGLKRITAITDAANATANRAYNALDAITSVSDFKGAVTTYSRNAFGESTQEASADAGTRVTAYDRKGLPTQVVDALGQATTTQRDLLGRPTQITFQDGKMTYMRYDLAGSDYNAPGATNASKGYLSEIEDRSGTTKWQRDALGRVTQKVQALINGATHTTTYSFNSQGLLDTLTYPGGGQLQHLYTAQGRLSSMKWNGTDLVTGLTWNAAGQPMGWTWAFASPIPASRTYDTAGRVTSTEISSYTYDAGGRITSLSQNLGQPADSNPLNTSVSFATTTFMVGYDAVGRITSFADSQGNSTALTYDANGNRLVSTEVKGSTTIQRTYSVDPVGNKLLGFTQQITGASGTTSATVTYTYNANGELIGNGLAQYGFNPENRLSSVAIGNTETSPTTRYAHNALGQRTFKTEPLFEDIPEQPGDAGFWASLANFFTRFWNPTVTPAEQLGFAYVHGENGALLGEYGSGGAQSIGSSQYIWLPTPKGPMPIAAVVNGATFAVHADHLNTPRKLTNVSGESAWQWKYSAFGDEQPTKAANRFADPASMSFAGSGTVADVAYNIRYPGQYADVESKLHYNYFRSYDARVGRYTQPDPIGLDGGWNRLGYASQNPLSFIDRLGLSFETGIDSGPSQGGGGAGVYTPDTDVVSSYGGGGSGYMSNAIAGPLVLAPTPASPNTGSSDVCEPRGGQCGGQLVIDLAVCQAQGAGCDAGCSLLCGKSGILRTSCTATCKNLACSPVVERCRAEAIAKYNQCKNAEK